MVVPNWSESEATLLDYSVRQIEQFAIAHPDEIASFVAYSVDYFLGNVQLCIDCPANALIRARTNEKRANKTWRMFFSDRMHGWKDAQYYVTREKMIEHSPDVGYFKYARLEGIMIPEWRDYFQNCEEEPEHDPEGHIIALLWRVVDRFAENDCLKKLKQSVPLRLGFQFFDDDLGLIVLRILNWPNDAERK
jgi:hypothetical protein